MPDPAWMFGPARPHRPCVMAQLHVVVSGHHYASLAGLQILEAGGNAIDAGVATGLAIDVLETQFVGFGGVAPIMVYLADRDTVQVINGVGPWPQAADIEHFHRAFDGRIPDGLLHTVVPAAPANWIEALARWGTMRFSDVAAAAIRFARDGFPAYPFFVEILADKRHEFEKFPTTAAIFLPDGRVPEVGETFVQADLARTLQYMADQEQSAGGDRLAGLAAAHDAFYRGDIAAAIVRHQAENGGWLRAADLAEFRARVEPPCRSRFGEFDVSRIEIRATGSCQRLVRARRKRWGSTTASGSLVPSSSRAGLTVAITPGPPPRRRRVPCGRPPSGRPPCA